MANKCVEEILKSIPSIDRADAERIVAQMSEARKSAFLDGMTNPASEYRKKAIMILENYRRDVEVEKVKIMQNMVKKAKIDAFVSNPIFEKTKDNLGTLTFKWDNGKLKGLEAAMVGSNDPKIKSSGESADAIKRGIKNVLSRSFESGLESSDFRIIQKGLIDDKIRIEQWDLANGGKGGKTGDATALRIAKSIQDLHKQRLQVLNDSGAFIRELDGFIGNQNHDPDAIRAAGFDTWKSKMLNYLDIDKTVSRGLLKEDINKLLEGAFKDITEGKSPLITSDADSIVKLVDIPGNVAAKMEQGRKLFFKDAESVNAYSKEFARYKTIGEELINNINNTARNASLMQKFGTNPMATIEILTKKYGASKPVQNWLLGTLAKELSGETSIPGKSTAAKGAYIYQSAQNIIRMGQSTLAQFDDLSRRAVGIQVAGDKSFLSPMFNSVTSLFSNLSTSAHREAAELAGIGADSLIGEINDRFSGMDGAPGTFGRASSTMMKLTGLNWLTESNKAAHAQMVSKLLGNNSNTNYAGLNNNLAGTLNRYSIGPVEWDLIRSTAQDGHIGFDGVLNIPNSVVEKTMKAGGIPATSPAIIERFKRNTSQKMATLYAEEVKVAMNESGAYERGILYRGTLQDSGIGVATRLMAQFKSFPLNSITQTMDRVALANGASTWGEAIKSGQFHVPAVATMIIGGTLMGYLSLSAKAIVANKTPPDPTDPKTILQAYAYGGGGGMYADFLLGEFDHRYGRSALQAVVGPIGGDIEDTFDLLSALKAGAIEADDTDREKARKKAAQDAFRMVVTRVPNLMYTKAALDYFILYGMKEYMSPGYTERMQERMQKSGQRFILQP